MKSIVNRVFGQDVIATVTEQLDHFVRKSSNIRSAVLSTADGFTVASAVRDDLSAQKLSAMSGSIYALAESVAREVSDDGCDTLTLESGSAKIVLFAIPDTQPAVILTVMTSQKALLGDLLYSARACGSDIQDLLIKPVY